MSRVLINVIAGPQQGRQLVFEQPETLIVGRSAQAGLSLQGDPYFSRQHFRLEINPPECHLYHLSRRNSTLVNEQPVESVQLRDGDVISGGETRILVGLRTAEATPVDEWQTKTIIGGRAVADGGPSVSLLNIPGYDLLEAVGQGAMGVVYRAVHQATQDTVALKVIIPESRTTPEALQLFAREASVLSQLHHPGIVQFREFGLVAGQLFLAMEYVPTVSVEELITRRSPERQVRLFCGIICRVLHALQYALEQSLVHRDIKPANILVSNTEQRLTVKLTDFGLAKNYAFAGFSGVTQEGQKRGTVAFMAPEQVDDSRFAKPSADIYATGATLYHFLTGSYPFELSSLQDGMRTILEEEPIPLDQRRPDLPGALVDIVHKALAKDPADRFRSAKSFRAALLPFSKSQ